MPRRPPTRQRVYVTGLGVLSCVGDSPEQLWKALATGTPGTVPLRLEEPLPCEVGAPVRDFDPLDYLSPQRARRTSRFQQLLLAAVIRARADARLTAPPEALYVGTGGGGLQEASEVVTTLRARGWRRTNRLALLRLLPNMAAGVAAQELGVTGPVHTLSTACASATDAIGAGHRAIRDGYADTVVVGGVESWLDLPSVASFVQLDTLSRRPADEAGRASRPFDRDRDGMVPAEGAAALVLESERAALARRAQPYAEVLGSASTCDASHLVTPLPDGSQAARAITDACADAGVRPEEIDHVSAHGTGTRLNDVAETVAVRRALGEAADSVPLTAPKSVLGHSCGACGAIESVGLLMSMRHSFVPPTANLDHPDPECDLDYTPLEGRPLRITTALKQNFGFGGQNSAVLYGAV
ncbi:beta-ketoacyl-[acyl-carrier-protein] synthase family protein [Streptomyces sp. NPDC005438]|uniref:beta-ketoacyl-[acyl-carrier-protein] synthase family protein n=1 Tax=Streptomyces sp. NPDC005438 TaxID=3156880 RepID=UPI0033AC8E56